MTCRTSGVARLVRAPGSTVTWGSSPSLPPPSPPLSLLFPSPAPPQSGPEIQLRVWGSAVSSPQRGVGRSPSQNRISCILALKSVMRHLMATILMIFLSVLPKKFSVAHYSGPQELGGPGSLNPWTPSSYATVLNSTVGVTEHYQRLSHSICHLQARGNDVIISPALTVT